MDQEFLSRRLELRRQQGAFRSLLPKNNKIDFCSNDYLGIVHHNLIGCKFSSRDIAECSFGSTGSRLLTGNYPLIDETEQGIANFHDAEAGLIFNSGYDANTGLLSCVPQRGDTVIYDSLSHASIRDGVRLSFARSFAFLHNDPADLEKKLMMATGNIFVVTESVFSMDGDMAPLEQLTALCEVYGAMLIVDEAHATGVIGNKGEGLVQHLNLQRRCFARVHTFGKATGCHGAAILGSRTLREYLVNFSRPFIYTTSLPEISVSAIKTAYDIFPGLSEERKHLQQLISLFQSQELPVERLKSSTPIQIIIIPGNDRVKQAAARLREHNLDVRAILYPTVPKESERLRIVLHSFNTTEQVELLLQRLRLEK